MSGRRAVFFDRDGTLIEDVHYIADPAKVVLRPHAARAVRRLNDAGWLVVVVTNQSGIARGRVTEDDYRRVAARTEELLASAGARIDATYYCPHLPEITGACDCRKPGVGMYTQAAREHDIDLAASAYIGDKLRDIEPAKRLGGLGILVPARDTPWIDQQRARDDYTMNTTIDAAVDRVLGARPTA